MEKDADVEEEGEKVTPEYLSQDEQTIGQEEETLQKEEEQSCQKEGKIAVDEGIPERISHLMSLLFNQQNV